MLILYYFGKQSIYIIIIILPALTITTHQLYCTNSINITTIQHMNSLRGLYAQKKSILIMEVTLLCLSAMDHYIWGCVSMLKRPKETSIYPNTSTSLYIHFIYPLCLILLFILINYLHIWNILSNFKTTIM